MNTTNTKYDSNEVCMPEAPKDMQERLTAVFKVLLEAEYALSESNKIINGDDIVKPEFAEPCNHYHAIENIKMLADHIRYVSMQIEQKL